MKQKIVLFLLLASVGLSQAQDFITRKGTKLTKGKDGAEIHLRGICFGNWVWSDVELPVTHHQEIDYKRVSAMGMNTVRFYLNYKTFEVDAAPGEYKETGWQWIDRNIQWAKKHGIYLILNMHVPQGGFQSQCKGDALWTIPSNQDRVVALWKAIAERYKDEPQIAGYDLINEPTPSVTFTRWKNLAQRLIDSIRTVDKNHLVIAERAIALGCDYSKDDGNFNFQPLREDNLMYTVHIYEPYLYTHQNQSWAGTGEGGKYPDESIVSAPSDAQFATGNYANYFLPAGNSDWTFSKGKPFLVASDTIIIGRPVFYGHKLGAGTAYYDDITLNEVDAQGNVIKQLGKSSFNPNGTLWFWSEKNDGAMGTSTSGHGDNTSITNTGTSGYSSIICADFTFKAEKGHYYAIDGWLKGTNIPAGATATISTEFSYSPSKSKVEARNYEFMKNQILRYSKYPRENGYPVYFGEFGLVRDCFQNGRGGVNWMKDVLHLFDSLDFHFTYHDYHEDAFGLYTGWNTYVDSTTVNTDLKKTFETFFLGDPVGLEDQERKALNDIQVFPNPSAGTFHVKNIIPGTEMKVVDIKGQLMLEGPKTEFGESLRPGMYYCQWKINDRIRTVKVVKE